MCEWFSVQQKCSTGISLILCMAFYFTDIHCVFTTQKGHCKHLRLCNYHVIMSYAISLYFSWLLKVLNIIDYSILLVSLMLYANNFPPKSLPALLRLLCWFIFLHTVSGARPGVWGPLLISRYIVSLSDSPSPMILNTHHWADFQSTTSSNTTCPPEI